MGLLRHAITALVIFGMLALGYFAFISDIANNYGITQDSNLTEIYSLYGSVVNESSGLGENITQKVEAVNGSGFLGTLEVLSTSMWDAAKMPFQAMLIVKTIISKGAEAIGLPTWVATGFIAIILISLAMIILSAFFRWAL